jgi:hypothetical protein
MTLTSSLVKTILQPWSPNGPKPTRVWGTNGITYVQAFFPLVGVDGTDTSVALAIEHTGRPLATSTPMTGAFVLMFDK